MAKLNVEVIVGLIDRLTRPLAGMQRNLQRTGARLSMIGMGASDAGRQMMAPLQDAARASMELESAMADVRKVVDFPSPDGLATMQAQLEEMTKTIPLAAAELAQIAAAGGQLGIAAPDLGGYVESVAKASTAFDMLPAEAGEAFAKLSNVFAIPIADISTLGDAINHLSNNSASKASDIVDALSRIGGTAKSFGLTAQQSSALASSMLAMGETSETASTALNVMLARLQTATKQGKNFQAGLASIGISADAMQQAIGRDAAGAVQMLMDKLSALPDAARMGALVDLFGIEHAPKLAKLAGNTEALAKSLGMVGDQAQYAGSMQAEFAARSDTTANQLQLVGNRAAELQRRVGDALLPAIIAVADKITPLIERMSAWMRANPELTGQLVLVGGALAAVLVVAGPVLMGIAGIMGVLSMGISVVGGIGAALGVLAGVVAGVGRAFGVLRLALALNPIGALLAVVAGAVWVFTHWEETIAAASKAWEWLIEKLGFDPVALVIDRFNALIDYLGSLILTLTTKGAAIGNAIGEGMMSGLRATWEKVKALARQLADALPNWVRERLGIQSPSRVFAAIGGNVMRGLSTGIARLSDLPTKAMAASTAAMLATPLSIASPTASGPIAADLARGASQQRQAQSGPISMPITIHISAPAGADAKAIAELVRREVSGATRQAAGRIAALYDGSDNL